MKKVAITSDIHTGNELYPNAFPNTIAAFNAAEPDLVLMLGDEKDISTNDFAAFLTAESALTCETRVYMRGNHDIAGGSWALFNAFAGTPPHYRTVALGTWATFFILDAWEPSVAPPSCPSGYAIQAAWLEAQLEACTTPFKFVWMHTPMYYDPIEGGKGPNLCALNAFRQIIDAGAHASFAGHRHGGADYYFGTAHHLVLGCCMGNVLHEQADDPIPGRVAHWMNPHYAFITIEATGQTELTATLDVRKTGNGGLIHSVNWVESYNPGGQGGKNPPPTEE